MTSERVYTSGMTTRKDGIKVTKIRDRVWEYKGVQIRWAMTFSRKMRYCVSFPDDMRTANEQTQLEFVSFYMACVTIDNRIAYLNKI
jgi:hypothetical protein